VSQLDPALLTTGSEVSVFQYSCTVTRKPLLEVVPTSLCNGFTDDFSGPGRACCPLCVCTWTITFQLNDLSWFALTPSRSCLKVRKVIRQVLVHRMKNVPFSAIDELYDVRYFLLCIW